MKNPQPSEPRTTTARIYETLRSGILSGYYPEGTALREMQLAEDLAVSRTPVREALKRLEADGFVVTRPHAGAFVRQWDAAEISATFTLRAEIEARIIDAAVERATAGDLARLDSLCDQMEAIGHDRSGEALARRADLNWSFHQELVRISGLGSLAGLLSQLSSMHLLTVTFGAYSEDEARRSNEDHRLMLRAIRLGSRDYARALMQAHILAAAARWMQKAQSGPSGR